METDYSTYSDTELTRSWNHLETCKLTEDVEKRMDLIMRECQRRGILSWDADGKITSVKD